MDRKLGLKDPALCLLDQELGLKDPDFGLGNQKLDIYGSVSVPYG